MSTFNSRFIMSVPVLELVLLLLLVASAAAEVIDTRYKDPKLPMNLRIKFLMEQMTLEEKIAQMAQINRLQAEADPKILRDYSIGSLITAPDSPPGGDHRASAEQWVDMVNGYQRWSLFHRLGIPMLYATDSVHGHNNLYRATIFPHNVGLGATRDPELVKRIGAVTAIETRASGIPYVFAPCIAAHRHLAREAVRKSLVLLKNGKDATKPLIPLPTKTSKILVAGTHANNLGLQCGAWTITWQGQNGHNLTTGRPLPYGRTGGNLKERE
ncbi:UNVERIFIED_CONTAM: hypothetical protein Sradi_6146600 [Sesamum radiatum]|uniref:Glycoside hydrolase family 3 N-terminal domain-containing protein n=1 Tax=Sesamum radiatum TaxID=300843 RepID=A0AAW2KLE5_SESRA